MAQPHYRYHTEADLSISKKSEYGPSVAQGMSPQLIVEDGVAKVDDCQVFSGQAMSPVQTLQNRIAEGLYDEPEVDMTTKRLPPIYGLTFALIFSLGVWGGIYALVSAVA
jgi:hypothetical protein